MRRSLRSLAALLVVTLLLAACGGGDDTLSQSEAEDAVAKALLTEDDLKSGFEKTSDEAPDDDEEGDDGLSECLGTDLDLSEDTIAESNTRDFERSTSETDNQQLTVSTAALPEDKIEELFEVAASERFADCMVEAFEEGLAEGDDTSGLTLTTEEPEVVEDQAEDADRSARISAPFALEIETLELEGRFDLVMVSRGQLVSLLLGFSLGEPIGEGELDRLGDLLVERQEV